jgi:hypothetical protein
MHAQLVVSIPWCQPQICTTAPERGVELRGSNGYLLPLVNAGLARYPVYVCVYVCTPNCVFVYAQIRTRPLSCVSVHDYRALVQKSVITAKSERKSHLRYWSCHQDRCQGLTLLSRLAGLSCTRGVHKGHTAHNCWALVHYCVTIWWALVHYCVTIWWALVHYCVIIWRALVHHCVIIVRTLEMPVWFAFLWLCGHCLHFLQRGVYYCPDTDYYKRES